MLSSVPADGLGLPGFVQYIELGCELGYRSWNGLLRLHAHIMGCAARGEDTSSLSQYMPYLRSRIHECMSYQKQGTHDAKTCNETC